MKSIILNKLQPFNPKLIIIFGSFAKGMNNSDSDLDIAFYSDENITNYQRWSIAQDIAIALDIDVDLVNLKKANDVLKFEIISSGDVILNKGMDSFLYRCFTNYFILNDDRKEILEHYAR